MTGTSDGKIHLWKQRNSVTSSAIYQQQLQLHHSQPQQPPPPSSSSLNSRFFLSHSAQVFTVSTLHIAPLTGYSYEEHPYAAIAGMVSKVVIYDVRNLTVVQSLRVLISNWQTYVGVTGMGEEGLAVGCLDGTVKIYKSTYE